MVHFSERTRFEAEPNALSREIARRRACGAEILDLSRSNPTRAAVPYAEDAILQALAAPRSLVYEPEPFGPMVARAALAREWAARGFDVPAADIVLTASTSEAYTFLFKLLCDPGDELLVPAPSYPLFEHLCRFEAVVPVAYPLRFDGAWSIDLDAVRSRRSARTRAVLCVSPNNPTGQLVQKDELRALADLGLPLISDEVFGSYLLEPRASAVRSALEADGTLVFALSGLSKLAALPQMKLAWISMAGPASELHEARARLELVADAFLSPNAPVACALPELLAARATSERHVLARLRANLGRVRSRVAGSPLSVLPVEGGWYAVLRLPRTQSEEAWVLGLLADEGVLVQPGYFFDFAEEAYVVVSLLTPEAEFDVGIERLHAYVQRS